MNREDRGFDKVGDREIAQTKPRVMRVFVSSTFKDMKEEREELVVKVFPRLRRLCEQRGVVWGEVDLRWGITSEEQAEGKVLPICLDEIRTCRPYFIGMLGERYGRVPREIPMELIEQEPWLKEHLEKSVTELEVLHGVLNDPEMADHAYFYFRDPTWVASKPKEEQAEFLEGPTLDELKSLEVDVADKRAERRRKRLAGLKERIRHSGLPLMENFSDPGQLGELVLKDFTELIDRLFPEGSEPEPLDKEAAEHEAFAHSRFRVYIGRQEYFDRLDEHARGDGQPLVILGESGSGKSALLANWSERYKEDHPDDLLIRHFIGATPYSSDWAAMLRRIMGEFKRRFDIQGDIPTEPDKLRSTFSNWLHMAAAKGRVILILDALNQLEDQDGAPDLVWLPPFIPANVRLVLSTLPGCPLDDLNKRGWPTMEVHPLTIDERKQLIQEFLTTFSKRMSEQQTSLLSNAEQTSNPLFLRVLLDELRIVGEFARLENQIEHYLAAKTVPDLLEKELERYERNFERERPNLVRDAMTAIWAARRGLSESELLGILGEDGNPLPRGKWSPLRLAAEQSLVSRSGLTGFSHDYMRMAVRDRYLVNDEDRRAAHARLADYFAMEELSSRIVDELPWQSAEASDWPGLYKLISDLDFFEAAWEKDQFDLKRYWARIEGESEMRMVEGYGEALRLQGDFPAASLMHLSEFLSDTGHLSEALSLLEYLEERFRGTADLPNLQACLGIRGWILFQRGDLDGAMKLYKEKERVCRELGDPAGLSKALNNQALILHNRGDLDGAMKLHKEEERVCRELGDSQGLQSSIGNQGGLLMRRGDLDGAMKLMREQERICRELGDPAGLSKALGNQALILYQRGDLDGALKFLREQERICRELGEPRGLSKALGNHALILRQRGDLDGAMKLMREQERICRELGDPAELSRALGNQALILYQRGDLDGAMKLHKEDERICRELGDPRGLYISFGNQALILYHRGDLDGAMKLHKEEERICRELGDLEGLQFSLGNQALILYQRGDLDGAMKLHKEEERICRELGDSAGLQSSLNNQAVILKDRGDLDGAMNLFLGNERICRELDLPDGLAESFANQASIFARKGEGEEALRLVEEAERLMSEHGLTLLAKEMKPVLDEVRSLCQ